MKFCLFGADSTCRLWAEKIQSVLESKRISVFYKFEKATVSNNGVVSIDDGKNILSSVAAVIIVCDKPCVGCVIFDDDNKSPNLFEF